MNNTKPLKPRIVKSTDARRHEYFISIPVKGANEIRNRLKLGESSFRYVASTSHHNSRDYYLYGVLDEIEKAGIALMAHSEFILGSRNENNENIEENLRLTRNIYTTKITEMSLWRRKLTEILIELVGFSKVSNSNDYFKHYLLIRSLQKNRKLKNDFQFYYHCNSENLEYQIKDTEKNIFDLLSRIDPTNCWYVTNKAGAPLTSWSSVEIRLKTLLPQMTAVQKLGVGLSYQAYSSTSAYLHTTLEEIDYDANLDDVDAHFSQIAILSAHCLVQIKQMIDWRPKKGMIWELSKMDRENNYPSELLKSVTKPNISLGDFVIAYGSLAEVMKINTSSFGYKSFRVRFLSDPHLPNINEDEFSARYVRLLYKKSEMKERMIKELLQLTKAPKIDNRILSKSLRESVIHMWEEVGGKEYAAGRPDLAQAKIKSYLAKNLKQKST